MVVLGVVVLVIAFTLFCSWVDCEHIERGQWVESHLSRWMMRFSFFCMAGMVEWEYSIASALLFTALFDQSLNLMRGMDSIWYLGTVAKWDLFFTKKYFLTPEIRWNEKVLVRHYYIRFNFMYLYIGIKAICLVGSLILFGYRLLA